MIPPDPPPLCAKCKQKPAEGCYVDTERACKECWEKLCPAWWRKEYGYEAPP